MYRHRRLAALVPCLLGALALTVAPPSARAAEALVIGQEGSVRPETDLAVQAVTALLQANGHLVTARNPHLGDALDDMDGFDCVWDIRTDFAWSPAEDALFLNYAAGGGNLFFSGEHAAFASRNNHLATMLDALGGGPVEMSTVIPPGISPVDVVEPTNPAAALTRECNSISGVDYDGVGNGSFTSLGSGTWLTGAPDDAGAAVWDRGSLPGAPDAKVVGILDINWLYDGTGGTLFWRVDDPTIPTENLAFLQNLVGGLCGAPPCAGACTPRNHGFWHRYCLGADEIDPGRNGGGNGPGPQGRHADLPDGLTSVADAAMASHGLTACQALDDGPFSEPRLAALRELATLHLNLAAGLLKRSCPIELHPVVDGEDLTVADALSLIADRLTDGSPRALREARWIGEHVANGEALVRER